MSIRVVQETGIVFDDYVDVPGWDDLEKKASSDSLESLLTSLYNVEEKFNGQLDQKATKSDFNGLKSWLEEEGHKLWNAVDGKVDDNQFNQRLDEIKHELDSDVLQSRLCELIENQLQRIDNHCVEHLRSINEAVAQYEALKCELKSVFEGFQNQVEAAVTLIVQNTEIASKSSAQAGEDLLKSVTLCDETKRASEFAILASKQSAQNFEQGNNVLTEAKEFNQMVYSEVEKMQKHIHDANQFIEGMKAKTFVQRLKWLLTGK